MVMLIRGGTVINHDHSRRADVLIDGGKIIAVGENLAKPRGPRSSMPAAAISCRRHRSAHAYGAHVYGHRFGR